MRAAALREPFARQPQELTDGGYAEAAEKFDVQAGDFHRQRLEGFAFAARKPQRRARRRRARAPRGKAQGQEPRGKAFIQGVEAAVQAQAALHFEQQLARRLERNLRRELAGPRRDRFEGVRRQAGKVECEPEHGQAFSPRGGAARWPAFRGA